MMGVVRGVYDDDGNQGVHVDDRTDGVYEGDRIHGVLSLRWLPGIRWGSMHPEHSELHMVPLAARYAQSVPAHGRELRRVCRFRGRLLHAAC